VLRAGAGEHLNSKAQIEKIVSLFSRKYLGRKCFYLKIIKTSHFES
jgi:ribosomal protein L17